MSFETKREEISVLVNGLREWWTVGMEFWEDDKDGPVSLFVKYAGIRQEVMPPAVAAEAAQIWTRWIVNRK